MNTVLTQGRRATDWKSEAEKCPLSRGQKSCLQSFCSLLLTSLRRRAFHSLGFLIRGSCREVLAEKLLPSSRVGLPTRRRAGILTGSRRKPDRTFGLHLEEAVDSLRYFEAGRLGRKAVPDRLLEELGRAAVGEKFLKGIHRDPTEHLDCAAACTCLPVSADENQQISTVVGGGGKD